MRQEAIRDEELDDDSRSPGRNHGNYHVDVFSHVQLRLSQGGKEERDWPDVMKIKPSPQGHHTLQPLCSHLCQEHSVFPVRL